MADLGKEKADLAKADRDITEGEKRVAKQILEVERLRRMGHNTTEAERSLKIYRETLRVWREHRALIEESIAALGRKK